MVFWHNGILYCNENGQTPIVSDYMCKFHKYNIEQKPPEQNNTYK